MKFCFLFIIMFIVACSESSEDNKTAENGMQPAEKSETTVARELTWQAPEGWQKQPPSSSMRKAEYLLPRAGGDPEDATVVIFYFQGEGGGTEANIERWAGQFVQPEGVPMSQFVERREETVNGLKQTIVDMSGTYLFQVRPMSPNTTEKPGFRMLAAVVESSSGPWFVKMVGPEDTVAKWEESFHNFMASFEEKE